ncbi:MAG: outer membrane beta-barrel protein [Sphingobacteriales bacterium]|nr:outer membrane beta-barrel protein [Sphingobacteriales bacterium]
MRKFSMLMLGVLVSIIASAQINPINGKMDFSPKANDHFMVQFSSDHWLDAPDSIQSKTKSISRGANVYVMYDKSFKENPKYSIAFGIGIGTSNVYFDKMSVNINGTTPQLGFYNLDTVSRFSKYKVSTAYAEIPLEFRYFSNPKNPNKSFKLALGAKIGTLINAHTKGKTLLNGSGTTVNQFTQKVTAKGYFNTTRIAATARVGYGNFSVFGSYNLTTMFKDNVAANIKLLQLGICISGL